MHEREIQFGNVCQTYFHERNQGKEQVEISQCIYIFLLLHNYCTMQFKTQNLACQSVSFINWKKRVTNIIEPKLVQN